MNEYSQPRAGKISVHGNGLGAPSPADVEKRAREIAMIDERNPDDFTDEDWRKACQELMGTENNTPTEEEETVGEHLVIDGLEEATHDQMLEARREELEQEGEIT